MSDSTASDPNAGLSRRSVLGTVSVSAAALGLGLAAAPGLAAASPSIRYLEMSRGKVAYRIEGHSRGRPPLLLLHRFRATIDDWDPAFINDLTLDRQVISFDSLGVGRSSGTPASSIEDMAAIALDLIKGLDLHQVDVLGWSMGGFVAQEIALLAPQVVRNLVIAGSSPGGITEVPATDSAYVEIASKPVNEDADFLTLFYPATEQGQSAGRAQLARLRTRPDRGPLASMAAVQAQGTAMAKWQGTRSRLGQLTMPVLVANGIHDVLMPIYGTYVIARDTPHAKAILYPDSGHAFLFQYPSDFAGELRKFLVDRPIL